MLARARASVRKRGAVGTARFAVLVARDRLRAAADAVQERRFDRRRGTDTRGRVFHSERDGPYAGAHDYQGVRPREFARVVAAVPDAPAELTFVDLGCGKGKALVLAAEAGFRRVIGVELSPPLGDVARANLRQAAGRDAEVVVGDATRFELPPEPLVLFLYNPFGPEPLEAVVDRASASVDRHPRRVFVAYLQLEHVGVLERAPRLRRLAGDDRFRVYEVTAATSSA